jgi:hypothetical protein
LKFSADSGEHRFLVYDLKGVWRVCRHLREGDQSAFDGLACLRIHDRAADGIIALLILRDQRK